MDVGEQLRRLRGLDARPQEADSEPAPARMPLERLVSGRWHHARDQLCFVAESEFPLDHVHGALSLGDLYRGVRTDWPQVLFKNRERFDLSRAVFVDTETTGLGRGPGTFCFLVGAGQIEGSRLVVRQFFMPDYGHEPLMLELTEATVGAGTGLITFNGRTFDLPLLETRYVINGRARLPFAEKPHLDLLMVARRLWGKLLPSCALSALECDLLDVRREEEDVPGYLIPQIYWDYLESGPSDDIARVFYHNLIDVLSMVTLAARVGLTLSEAECLDADAFRDPVALGRLYEAEGNVDAALAAYRQASLSPVLTRRLEAQRRLSFLLKRLGRWEEAVVVWEKGLDHDELYPFVELAKHHEHRCHDYAAARDLVLSAMSRLREGRLRSEAPGTTLEELRHRLHRLERRMGRQ